MATTATDLLRRMDEQKPGILAAFLRFVRRIVDAIRLDALVQLLEQGRLDEIPVVLRLRDEALSPLTEAVRTALIAGGESIEEQAGIGALVQFDVRNTAAENWIRQHSAELVTDIMADQRNAIRAVVRAGVEAGRNPRSIALDIIGRVDQATGSRVGGIVGLTEQQATYVSNARTELERLSVEYFSRKRRDKRFDSVVRKAIKSGKSLTAKDIDKIVSRYADRLLQLRGETIARTESLEGFNAGRDLAMQQAIRAGTVRAENVTAYWETAHDPRVRESHREMQGQRVPFGEPFVTPRGASLRFPGDSSQGAPAEEVIQCRCIARYKIDWISEGRANGS